MRLVLSLLLFTQLIFAAENSFKGVTEQELSPHIRESIDKFCEDYSDPEQCALELGTLPLDKIRDILGLNYHSAGEIISSGFYDVNNSEESYIFSLKEEDVEMFCGSYRDPEWCVLELRELLKNQSAVALTLNLNYQVFGGFQPVGLSNNLGGSFSAGDGS